jgi:outer membrane receptor protein involved in Fe transport
MVEIALTEQAISMPEVVVSATREARRLDEIAASVGVIGRRQISEARASHPSEIMSKVPGVWVNVTGGEGHMTAIRQPLTTDPVYLFLEDGVPTRSTGFFNHNGLYEINLPQAERIEVMKGPANALYGSDAIGGVINVQTRTPTEEVELQLTTEGGGHGFGRVLASASMGTPLGDLRTDLNYTRTDGWRDGTGYDRWSGTARLDHRLNDGLSIKTVAAYSNIDQSTAGSSVLSRADFESSPTRNYTPISWRKVTAMRLSSEVEKLFGETSLVVTPYVRSNSMDLLPNWSLTFDPAVWETSNLSFGLLAKVRRELPGDRGEIIAGVDVDVSPGEHVERTIQPAREGAVFTGYTEGSTIYDYDVTFRQAAPYLHAELAATERLRLTGGLRLDVIDYSYENHLGELQTGRHRRPGDASPSYSALSPKLGVTFQLTDATSLFGAYRRGFRVPSEGQLFRQGSAANTVGLEPVKSDAFEVGVRGLLGSRVRFDLSAYHMRMFDEILGYQLADGSSENVNAGETLHRGVEVGMGVVLARGLQLDLAYTLAEHTYEDWSPRPDVQLSGKEQDSAPNHIAHTELSWSPWQTRDAQVALTWDYLGPYWMDQTNEHEYEGHDLFGARASFSFNDHVGAFLRVTNLADTRYAERASYNAFRGEELAPGLPRTLYFGVELR